MSRKHGSRNIRSARHHLPQPAPQRSVTAMATAAAASTETGGPPTVPPKPQEQPEGMGAEAALLEAFAEVPAVSGGWCWPGADPYSVRIALQLAQRNLAGNAQRKYLAQFALSEAVLEQGCELDTGLPIELRDVVALAPSPSGRRTLVVRGGSGEASAVLEVWDRTRLLKELHVPKALHGGFYNDGWFGSGAAWAPNESHVAYVAEAPPPARTPEWGARPAGPDGKKAEGAAPKGWRGVGEWEEDWGELHMGKRPPALFVLDCERWEVAAVRGLPAGASCGQPAWSPEGDALLFVAWPHSSTTFPSLPQRLGALFCFNRPCSLHAVAWPQADVATAAVPSDNGADGGAAAPAAVCLTPRLASAFSPRFSPDGQTLVFLSQRAAVASGVHAATSSLHSLGWGSARAVLRGVPPPPPRTVVDAVWAPTSADAFPGLYAMTLTEQPFVGDRTVVMTSAWRSLAAVVAVDLATGEVARATPANGASWSLVAAGNGWLLAQESHPGQPFVLYATHVPAGGQAAADGGPWPWSWSRLELPGARLEDWPPAVRRVLPQLCATPLVVAPTTPPTNVGFEAVVLHQADREGPRPTVVTPHGGPHSVYLAQFYMPLCFLASLGYNVVLVNYRGSIGFGEESVLSLPGNVGTNDVADCMAALAAAVDAGYADPARVALVGGSHGGFLAGHLLGQHPAAFRAGVMRNPVCDLSVMVNVSDIPDWCYVEAWGTEEGRRRAAPRPSAEDLARFRAVSPIAHIDKARSSVHAWVFPEDAHGLEKPQTEFELWLNTAAWLKRHL
eukprot:scaffold12.g8103.t1